MVWTQHNRPFRARVCPTCARKINKRLTRIFAKIAPARKQNMLGLSYLEVGFDGAIVHMLALAGCRVEGLAFGDAHHCRLEGFIGGRIGGLESGVDLRTLVCPPHTHARTHAHTPHSHINVKQRRCMLHEQRAVGPESAPAHASPSPGLPKRLEVPVGKVSVLMAGSEDPGKWAAKEASARAGGGDALDRGLCCLICCVLCIMLCNGLAQFFERVVCGHSVFVNCVVESACGDFERHQCRLDRLVEGSFGGRGRGSDAGKFGKNAFHACRSRPQAEHDVFGGIVHADDNVAGVVLKLGRGVRCGCAHARGDCQIFRESSHVRGHRL